MIKFIREYPTIWTSHHRQDKEPVVRAKVDAKTIKLVIRGYLIGGVVLALTYFFAVIKRTE